MWRFRNGVAHGSDGPEILAHHSRLNREIGHQFLEGFATLLPVDRHRLRNSTPSQVRALNLVTKQNWVASLQAAWKAFSMAGQPTGHPTLHNFFPPAP